MSEGLTIFLIGIVLGGLYGYHVGRVSLYGNIMDELKRRCLDGSTIEIYSFREELGRWFQSHKLYGGKWEKKSADEE